MKNARNAAAGLAAAMLAAFAQAAPPTVNPEQMDMGVEINAKIGKEKAKRNALSAGIDMGGSAGAPGKTDCGSVNINSNDKKSNSGIKDMFGKQTTTIVTGPVINMANCK